jgi:benzoyl-CoA reductase/2-hydroxyglutaryl-CoA dehydratase subunit BcrC/BadD/HgdB
MDVFHSSPWVPPEWIAAHGFQPRGAWCSPRLDLPSAALAEGVCAFAGGVLRLAEAHPEAGIVLTTHCDQLRRGFDALNDATGKRTFLFNLPATWQTPTARRLYQSELERLGRFLVKLGGAAPDRLRLEQVFQAYDQTRRHLRAAAETCSGRRLMELLAHFHWTGEAKPCSETESGTDGVPLALVGGPLPPSHWGLLEQIERAGGRIVLDGTEAGERSLLPQIRLERPAQAGDRQTTTDPPLPGGEAGGGESLAQAYFDAMTDVFQRPNTRLYDWLRVRLAARRVRGLVLWHYVGCDLWRAEAQSLREGLGLPVLLLDADETAAASARSAGRIAAFVECLQ